MTEYIIIKTLSDSMDAGTLLLTEIAIAFGVLGTGLGIFNLVRKRAPKKKKPDKELAEYAKKEKDWPDEKLSKREKDALKG